MFSYSQKSKRQSPWGEVDQTEKLLQGMIFVFTPGHGGLMLTERFAEKYLSAEAISYADVYSKGTNKRLCYEEDCAYAIVFWELLDEHAERIFSPGVDVEEKRKSLRQTLTSYYPNYLKAVGAELAYMPA